MENYKNESEKLNIIPAEALGMYRLPGQEEITEHSLERYQKDKENFKNEAKGYHTEIPITIKDILAEAPISKMSEIIKEGLKSKDMREQLDCAEKIGYVKIEDRSELIQIGLQSDFPEVRWKCAWLIGYLPKEKKSSMYSHLSSLISEKLDSKNIALAEEFAGLIKFVPGNTIPPLLQKGLESNNLTIQKLCASNIWNISLESKNEEEILTKKVSSIIEKGLKSENENDRLISASMIEYASIEKRASFTRDLLMNGTEKLQEMAAEMIHSSPRNEIASLIQIGLDNQSRDVQKKTVSAIEFATENERAALFEKALSIENAEIHKICAMNIDSISNNQDRAPLYLHLSQILEKGLASDDEESAKIYTMTIHSLPEKYWPSLLEAGLKNIHPTIQSRCLKMIHLLQDNEKEKLFDLAKKQLGNNVVESRLYEGGNISEDNFSRKDFLKTGSELTLIGGDLKNKTVLREIEINPFLVWQRLFEDYQLWKDNGFDYVPIEPIQSFKMTDSGMADVYSGVLDLSFYDWYQMTEDFRDELTKDRNMILRVLRDNAIIHGHPHDNNFSLKFFHDENGNVDFTKKPRIYLIDFDQAENPENEIE